MLSCCFLHKQDFWDCQFSNVVSRNYLWVLGLWALSSSSSAFCRNCPSFRTCVAQTLAFSILLLASCPSMVIPSIERVLFNVAGHWLFQSHTPQDKMVACISTYSHFLVQNINHLIRTGTSGSWDRSHWPCIRGSYWPSIMFLRLPHSNF